MELVKTNGTGKKEHRECNTASEVRKQPEEGKRQYGSSVPLRKEE